MIKFLDLKNVNARFESQFKDKFSQFLSSGTYVLGSEIAAFEKEYATYCGTEFCVGVSSGVDAIHLIFEAYKILGKLEAGDEVIVPANTYIASVLAINKAGLKPVLVEPKLETYNIDPEKTLKAITPKTKAILGVHLYGQLYDVEELEKISKTYNLLLVEDSAQAHGAIYKDGRKAGNVSDVAAFSFYPTKNLGALGDAGAITTNNEELSNIIRKLRNYGRTSAYVNDIKGGNYRIDELQAAFLRVKLQSLESDNKKRREIAKYYLKNINSKNIVLPICNDLNQHAFHLFVIRNKKRDLLKDYLYKKGVQTFVHYPIPIHRQLAYSELKDYTFPITEKIHEEVLSIPLNHALEMSEINEIVNVLSSYK